MVQLSEYRLHQMTTQFQSKILIITTFGIMQIAIYRDFLQNTQEEEQQLLSILQYIDLLYILRQPQIGQYVQAFVIIFSLPIPILFLIIYIQKRIDKFSQPFNQFHGQAVLFSIQTYVWVLFYPFFEMLFFNLPCNKTLMDCTKLNIYYAVIMILNAICLIFMIIIAILTPYLQNDQFQKKDFLNIDNPYGFLIFNLYRIFLALTHNLNSNQLLILIPQIVLTLYLYYSNQNGSFIVFQQQNLFNFLLQQQISLYIACYLSELTKLFQIGTDNSSLYYVIVCFTFNIYLYRIQQERQITKLLVKVNTFDMIKRKINIFNQFLRDYQISQTTRQTICWGLIVNHLQNKCFVIMNRKIQFNCFCNQRLMYFAKKGQDCSTNQRQLYLNYIQYFNFICKTWLEEYIYNNPNNNEAIIYFAKYLFYKLRLIQQSILVMQKFKTYNPYLKFERKFLYEQICILQSKTNFNSYLQKLQFEDVLSVEQAINDIQQLIIDIINQNIKFWKLYLRPIVKENDIMKCNTLIQSKINKCEQLWDGIVQRKAIQNNNLQCYNYLNKHYKWIFQYCWYQLFILNKFITQQLLDQLPSQTPKMEQLVKDEPVSEDSENERDYFYKINKNKPYSDQTAIIHTNCDKDLIIQKVNDAFINVFGYKKKEVIQKSINQLLPNIIIRNHKIFVSNFIHKGKDQSLYSKKIIFALNKYGYLMQCSKYLKFMINPNQQIEFICMIRQIKIQSYIILLNLDWEIESMSQQLQDLEIFQKVSLLILCPKLLQYSNYQNYLQVQDLDNFELNIKRQSKLMIGDRRYTYNRKPQSIQDIDYNPGSLIFKQHINQPQNNSDSETSIIEQLLIEESTVKTERKRNKFHHIVNANHVQLNFRIPKNIDELIDLYKKQKRDCLEQQLPEIYQRIVDRDENNQLFLHKNRLLRQIRIKKQLYYEKMLDNFRFLYNKYLRRKQGIKQIIKLDVNIQFPLNNSFDKYIVLVVNKIETHQNRQRKQEVVQSNKFIQNQPQNTSSMEQMININQIDFNSNRTYNTKPLLTEILLAEEIQFQDPILSLRNSDNLFIKKENNKPQKYQQTLRIFNIINRLFVLGYFACVIIMYLIGYSKQIDQPIKDLGITQLNLNMQILRSIAKTYDITLELGLFNTNITEQIVQDPSNTPYKTREEFLNSKKQEISKIFDFIFYIYLDQHFIKMYYKLSTNYNDSLNAIDLFNQYQNNLVEVYLAHPENINLYNENLIYFRKQTYPQLFSTFEDTKDNLIKYIENQLILEQNIIVYFLMVGIVMVIISIFASVVILNKIYNKLMVIYKSQANIQKKTIYEIINYQVSLHVNFSYFVNFNNEDQRFDNFCIQQIDEINELKLVQAKQSLFMESILWKNKKIKSILLYCIFFLIIIGMPLFYNLYVMIQLIQIRDFINRNTFINNFDQFFILTALKECYLNYNDQSNIEYDQYKGFLSQYIQKIQDINQQIYQSTIPEIQQVFNGNVCESLQNDSTFTDVDDQYCQQLIDGTLIRGIKQYDYLLAQQIMNLLNNDTRYEKINFVTLQKFTTLQKYVFAGLQKAWDIWQQEYFNKADSLSNFEITLMILSLINMIFHYIILERILFTQLNNEYKLAKIFYKRFMPIDVITNQKGIRVELIRSDLLKR
ncbi:hypothetical protein pb186bvf_003634 [Paramecium bursaria]